MEKTRDRTGQKWYGDHMLTGFTISDAMSDKMATYNFLIFRFS